MGLEFALLATVKPGSVSTNFEQFKEILQKEMDENYKNIVVTDEALQSARAARATLNKAKAQLKSTVTAAKKENQAPLEKALEQAKELEAIIDDAINTLDVQIKEIETARREKRMTSALKILNQKLDRLEDPEVRRIAEACRNWLVNPSWGLSTCTFTELNNECDEKIKKIVQANELFQGDFRDKMLESFYADGDIGKAQLLGNRLQKEFEEAEKRKAERLAKEAEAAAAPKTNQAITTDTIPTSVEKQMPVEEEYGYVSTCIKNPESYKDKYGIKKGHADFRITCEAYKYRWLLDLCKEQGIELTRLDKKEN